MRRILFLLVFVSALSASAQAPETAIHQLLDKQQSDWNRGDVDAFMAGYDDSPNTIFIGQKVEYGYANIRNRYQQAYATPAAMGKLTFSNLAIRPLDAGYAVATGNFHLDRETAGGGNADGIFSLVFRKEPSGWKIILDHSSRTH